MEGSGTIWSEVGGVTWALCELGGLSRVARVRWKELRGVGPRFYTQLTNDMQK